MSAKKTRPRLIEMSSHALFNLHVTSIHLKDSVIAMCPVQQFTSMTIQPGCNKFNSKVPSKKSLRFISQNWFGVTLSCPSIYKPQPIDGWHALSPWGEGKMVIFDRLYMALCVIGEGVVCWEGPWLPLPHCPGCLIVVSVCYSSINPENLDWVEETTKPLEFHLSATCVGLRKRRPINSHGLSESHWCGQSNCKSSSRGVKQVNVLLIHLTENPR